MNLTIAPVNMKNNYNQNNIKNNNAQQDFGIKIKLRKPRGEGYGMASVERKRDITVDVFMAKMNEITTKKGLVTKILDEKYMIDFVPEFALSSKMTGYLKTKRGRMVQDKGFPIMVKTRRGHEEASAQEFVNKLEAKNLFG